MTDHATETQIVPDSEYKGLVGALPPLPRSLALMARFDRPIGWWLLYWPCLFGLGLAGGMRAHWPLALWMLLGAIAMRGAGCVYNDIIDRDLDAKVARTASRPLASGAVSLKQAWIWLISLSLLGLIVLLQLRPIAQIIALSSLVLVALYPFMKRITWWPQAWLGLVFSWGAPVGWLAVQSEALMPLALLYLGTIFWVIGYDTIYALQDREDDALVGIKSSALAMGKHVILGTAICYAAAILCWAGAIWTTRPQWLAMATLLPAALHLIWQISSLDPNQPDNALDRFRSNRNCGFLVALAMMTVGSSA